jgi:tripartite-type tricarboxylate transporter receptor subunit TctC
MKQNSLFKILCIVLALVACPSLVRADYPDRGIKIIVAWPPGGATDKTVVEHTMSGGHHNTPRVTNKLCCTTPFRPGGIVWGIEI